MNVDAESTAQGQGRAEDGAVKCSGQPHGQGESRSPGGELKHLRIGAPRTFGPWGALPNPIAGGIIAQLIAQVEDQLSTAQECITWYEREVEKYTRQLENLKQLQELAATPPEE